MTREEHNRLIDIAAWVTGENETEEHRKVKAFEAQLCAMSFPRFLRWCMIVEPPTLESPGGIIPFQLWKSTRVIIKALLSKRLIVILKSRQIGASWIIAAYVLWYALHKRGANILLFSKGEGEAAELLDKCKRIYNHLPPFFKLEMDPKSTVEIGFPFMESKIKALAATSTAGISFTASLVVCDEHEEHPFAVDNFMSAKPTIDAGGQFVSIFTVNKKKASTLAKTLFKGAPGNGYSAVDGEGNGFTPLFFPYWVRPGRDENWYKRKMAETPVVELEGLTPELYMEQNYPRSVEEALRPTSTVSAFDLKVLEEMLEDVSRPIKITAEGIDTRVVKLYKDPVLGGRYIGATDTSHGVGLDFSVTVVMNVRTGEVVGDIMNKNMSPEELAAHSVKLMELFQKPTWFIETNDWGQVTLVRAQALNNRQLGGTTDKRGSRTLGLRTGPANRPVIWGDLIPAINGHQITIHNADGIRQFMDVIRNAENGGRVEAMSGGHDDYPMAVGIAWYKRDAVPITEVSYEPISSLTFSRRQ